MRTGQLQQHKKLYFYKNGVLIHQPDVKQKHLLVYKPNMEHISCPSAEGLLDHIQSTNGVYLNTNPLTSLMPFEYMLVKS